MPDLTDDEANRGDPRTPEVGDAIEMTAPYGPGWIRATVTHVSRWPARDGGTIAVLSASGDGPGPHITSFWPGEHFRLPAG